MAARTLTLVGLIALSSCGGDDKTMMMVDPPDDGPLQPLPPEGGQQLTTTEFTLQPGEEAYLCWTWRSPAEGRRAITEIMPIAGAVVHHIVLVKTRSPETESFFECPELLSTNWEPLWASGAGGNGLVLPENVGFMVDANSQYLIQLHLLNSGETPVTERMGLNLRYAPDASTITPAGFYPSGSFQTVIPAGAMGFTQTINCQIDREMNVFAVFPHMHQLGKHMVVETGAELAAMNETYRIDPWVFGDQPFDEVEFTLPAGTHVRTTCTWDNDTNMDVTFGESTFNEMCFSVLFYYPFSDLVFCIDP